MNIRKEKLDLFKAMYLALRPRLEEVLSEEQMNILHLYIAEHKGLLQISEEMHFANYKIVKAELNTIELKILALANR